MESTQIDQSFIDYKIADIKLADWGHKEVLLAEAAT